MCPVPHIPSILLVSLPLVAVSWLLTSSISLTVIIDSLNAELQKRLGAYTGIASKFGSLRNLKDLSDEKVIQSVKSPHKAYPICPNRFRIQTKMSNKLLQFSGFLNTEFAKKSLNATTSSAVPRTDTSSGNESDDIHLNMESLEMRMYRLLVSNNLEIVFPTTEIGFQIYLSLMIWKSYGERSFSKMKLIKSQLCACMKQE